jgi:hypothetical protein
VRAALAAVVLAAASALAGEIPGAVLVLEAAPGTPGADAAAAPPRFVLLEDGQVFVGGDARVEAGRLEKREAQALLKRAEALRRLPGVGPEVALGGRDDVAFRLRLLDGRPLEVRATGDPALAPAPLAPLAALVSDLARFHHPSLRPFAPSSYAMVVREARLVGGCREWTFPFPLASAQAAPRTVSASEAEGWPTGALPASVCADDKRYAVTLRPLLPGEQP